MNIKGTFLVALTLVLATALFVGCKRKTPDGMPKLYPCSVEIIQDGKPLADATVTLSTEEHTWAVSGTTDASGVAKIYTHGTYPGAPNGNYVVVVSKQIVEEPEAQQVSASDAISGGKAYNLVAPEFGSKDTTPLKIEVNGKTNGSFDVGAAIRDEVKAL